MNTADLQAKLDAAAHRLATAEAAMEQALHQVSQVPREDKSIISETLGSALAEMKAARQELQGLKRVIAAE